jgi:cytochrome c-type biogenesis protein CcmH
MKDIKDINVLAQQIDRQLMCPVCPSETIDQSQTLIAKQMKAIIRDKLNQGQNTKEILNYFVDRYGIEILTEPPKSGWHLLIWIVPPVGLLLGSAIVGLIILSMRKNSLENINQPQLGDINKYLLEVEKVLENTDTEAHTNNPQKNETGDN